MSCRSQERLSAWRRFLNLNHIGKITAGMLAKSRRAILNQIVLISQDVFLIENFPK